MFGQVEVNFAAMKIADGSDGQEDPWTQSTTTTNTPIMRKNRIVGYEDEEATITGYLKERKDILDVITIFGVPRQGKTTLAWKIYHDQNTNHHFPTRIWIPLSQNFDKNDVFLQILRQLPPTNHLNGNEPAETVRACLENDRFLLVLDDLCSVAAWKELEEALPLRNGEGKVLITSRSWDVAKHLSSAYRTAHELRLLDDDESWALLQYEVFGNLEDCPRELSGIGHRIATGSDGVLLVIFLIGGVLADTELTGSEWETVARNVRDAFDRDTWQHITNVIEMSYGRLADGLRECFVFLGVFPEGYEILVELLFELWIGEGLIVARDGMRLEERALENLNHLIRLNLLVVEKEDATGKVETCRVVDMIRAFCIAKCKEENLFREIKVSETDRRALDVNLGP